MEVTRHIAVLAALTTAIGWTMVYAGAKKKMVDMRARRRVCPSCGHRIAGRVCDRH